MGQGQVAGLGVLVGQGCGVRGGQGGTGVLGWGGSAGTAMGCWIGSAGGTGDRCPLSHAACFLPAPGGCFHVPLPMQVPVPWFSPGWGLPSTSPPTLIPLQKSHSGAGGHGLALKVSQALLGDAGAGGSGDMVMGDTGMYVQWGPCLT